MSQEKELDMIDRDPNQLNAHVKVYFVLWKFYLFYIVRNINLRNNLEKLQQFGLYQFPSTKRL